MVNSTLTSCLPATAADDLVLRVCGSSRDGQLIRLRSDKCTIGSAPRCTLRLRSRFVGPLHCLILRGPGGTIVRRWSDDTRLNGRTFQDVGLKPGDRLGIGNVELEVVATGWPTAEDGQSNDAGWPTAEDGQSNDAAPTIPAEQPDLANQDLRPQTETERADARQQLDEQAAQLDARRAELDARQAEHAAHCAELDARQKTLDDDRQRWEATRARTLAQSIVRQEELGALAVQIEAQRHALELQQQQWGAAHAETQRQLDGRAAELETLQAQCDARLAELEAQRQSLLAEQASWQAQRDQTQRQLDEQAAELEASQAQCDARLVELNAQRRSLLAEQLPRQADLDVTQREVEKPASGYEAREDAPAGEPEFQAVSSAAPVSLADVLRRVGSASLMEDAEKEMEDGGAPAQHAAQASPAHDSAKPEHLPKSPAAGHADEESIDDYMTRLMARVRGADDVAETPRGQTQSAQPRPAASDQTSESSQGGPVNARPIFGARHEPVEMAPRKVAPERHVNLLAMRELANLSAQHAITRHARRQMVVSTRSKLLITIIGLATGGALLWAWGFRSATTATLYAALACFLVGGFWGIQYAVLTGRLIRNKLERLGWAPPTPTPDQPAEDDTPAPTEEEAN
jgi:hypothetical protein